MEAIVQYPHIEYLINKKIWRVHWRARTSDHSFTDCLDERSANLMVEEYYSRLEEARNCTVVWEEATDEQYDNWIAEKFQNAQS